MNPVSAPLRTLSLLGLLVPLTLAGCAGIGRPPEPRAEFAYYCQPGSALKRPVPAGRSYPEWMLWKGTGTCKHR